MGNPVIISVDKELLTELLIQTRRMVAPEAKYCSDNEVFLKGIISQQRDRAEKMNTILTNILFGS